MKARVRKDLGLLFFRLNHRLRVCDCIVTCSMAMKSIRNSLLDLFACIPVSVVVAQVLMAVVALMVTGVYFAFNLLGG